MPKPGSIRTVESLLYVNLFFMLFSVVRFIQVLAAPSPKDPAQTGDLMQAASLMLAVTVLMSVGFILAIRFIRRKKRTPAVTILAIITAWWLLSGSSLSIWIGALMIFLLFTRSATAYFMDAPLEAQQQAEPARDTSSDPETSDDQAVPAETRPVPRVRTDPTVEIRPAGAAQAETVHSLMLAAFEEYRAVVPPSTALDETVESVREALQAGQGAAILYEDEQAVAMIRYEFQDDAIYFFRLSVLPARRRRGYSKQLVRWIERLGRSKGLALSRCKVRQTVQNNVAMYQDMGYDIVDQELVVRPAGSVKALKMEKKLQA